VNTLNYCKRWFLIGCLLAALAVLLGAFGAHSLEGQMEDSDLSQADMQKRLGQWETAVRYHMYHALGCIVVAFASGPTTGSRSRLAGIFFLCGILFFSGGLYGYVLTHIRFLVLIVPVGGLAFILGWLLLAFSRPASLPE
jgi:uncharacterized membrane protein YgdD (TMEM256/DUF423 family)